MDIGNVLSSYNISENNPEGKKTVASKDEQVMNSDLFAVLFSLLTNPEGTQNVMPEQTMEAIGAFRVEANSGQGSYQITNEFADLTAFSKVLLHGTGNGEALIFKPETVPGSLELDNTINVSEFLKDVAGEIKQVKNNSQNQLWEKFSTISELTSLTTSFNPGTNEDLSTTFSKNLFQGIGNGNEATIVEAETRSGAPERANEINVFKLLEDVSGEIKQVKSNSHNQSEEKMFPNGLKAVQDSLSSLTSKDKGIDTIGNKDLTLDSAKINGSNQLIQGENLPQGVSEGTSPLNSFSLNQQQGLDSAKIWARVADYLKQIPLAADNKDNTVKEIEIKLHPAELGKLEVNMKMEDGMLHLVINASDQATGSYLRNYLGELRQSLTQMGISCGSMEMGNQGDGKPDQEKEKSTPKNHDFYWQGETENLEYGKAMYNLQDLRMQTRINVNV